MNIGIIGGGATGLMTSYYLSRQHNVTLYVRRNVQMRRIIKNGINQFNNKEPIFVNTKIITELSNQELIIICVKSLHLNEIIKIIKQLGIQTPLLFLQNGMGHVSLFQALDNELFAGVIEHGVVRENDFTFNHLGKGSIKIASLNHSDSAPHFVSRLSSDKFPFKWEDNWESLLKEKLIINAVINPLTTLFDVENRYVIENSHINSLARQLCEEVAITLKLDCEKSWKNVVEISRKTGKNSSSMRSDILNKRKTEIDAILGYILSIDKNNLSLVKTMYQSIKALEERNQI